MSLEPRLLVTYHGLAGSGVALVAYDDGEVILEEEAPPSSPSGCRGPHRHRQERFASLSRAREALGLPLRLPAGQLSLHTDPRECCPTFQVFRFQPAEAGRAAGDEGAEGGGAEAAAAAAALTRVRFGFGPDDPVPGSAEFRAFRDRVASFARAAQAARPLAVRLGLSDQALDMVLDAARGLVNLDEKLEMLGLAERFGEPGDAAWPAEVRRASAQIRAKLNDGLPLKSALREVLFRSPGRCAERPVVDLTGWEAVVEPASAEAGGLPEAARPRPDAERPLGAPAAQRPAERPLGAPSATAASTPGPPLEPDPEPAGGLEVESPAAISALRAWLLARRGPAEPEPQPELAAAVGLYREGLQEEVDDLPDTVTVSL